MEQQLGFKVNLTGTEMQTLISNGKLTNASRSFAIGLFQLINSFNILLAPAYNTLGDGLLAATAFLRENIEFPDHAWNPEAGIPTGDGKTKENKNFKPILLPFTHEVIDTLSEAEFDALEKVTGMLRRELMAQRQSIRSRLDQFSRLSMVRMAVPDSILQFLDYSSALLTDLIDEMVTGIETVAPSFAAMGKTWLNMINAFYCGLWNALVEAVLGIVDLLGYIFKLMGAAGDAMSKAQKLIPQAQEMLDELIQSFSATSMAEMFSNAFTEVYTQVRQLDLMGWTSFITPEKVAYFVGSLMGIAVETLVGIASGGSTEIAALANKLERFGKLGTDMFSFMTSSVANVTGMATGFSLENIMNLIGDLLDLIRKGSVAVVDYIRSMFSALRRGFQSLEKFIEEIRGLYKITFEQLSEAKRLGMEFTGLYDDYCTLCLKSV